MPKVRKISHGDFHARATASEAEVQLPLLIEEAEQFPDVAVSYAVPMAEEYTKYPCYLAYRATGVEWLGDVPSHWRVTRLKNAATVRVSTVDKHVLDSELPSLVCHYVQVYYNRRITASVKFVEGSVKEEEAESFKLQQGDVIITKDSETPEDIAVATIVAEDIPNLVCGYHLAILRPTNQQLIGAYLYYLTASQPLRAYYTVRARGVTRYGLAYDGIAGSPLLLPPLPEQRAIAAFLDAETARIDALVAKQEALIALLEEKRRAVISHAVTKGLDADAPMKDSGVPWLGEVPAHWEVKRLKFIANVRTGVAKGRDLSDKDTIELPYLRVANVQDGYLDLTDVATIQLGQDEIERYLLHRGDVLMNEGGDNDKLGRGYVWENEVANCVHQNHVFAVRLHDPNDAYWVNLVTQTSYAKQYFLSRSKQSTNLASISSTNLQELPVVLPPRTEKGEIRAFVGEEFRAIDNLIVKSQQCIDLLREHRTALIAAAVTGQIDVRGAAGGEAA